MSLNVYAFIFARGGSKGLPGKNIMELGGKPLLAHSIETALQSKLIDKIFVSTDDAEIAQTARDYGAEVPFIRPSELAQDDSPEWLAWQHAIQSINSNPNLSKMDIFVSLPATAPLRSVEDVENCIRLLDDSGADIVVTIKNTTRHPSFNMVSFNRNGLVRLAVPCKGEIYRRQDAPEVFDMTTVAYVAKPDFILRAGGMFEGKVAAVTVPEERGIDIDTAYDFALAEFLMSRKNHEISKV